MRVLDAPLDCVPCIHKGLLGDLQKFQSALLCREALLWVIDEAIDSSFRSSLPVHLRNQNSVAKLHHAVMARFEATAKDLHAGALREINPLLFHIAFISLFFIFNLLHI